MGPQRKTLVALLCMSMSISACATLRGSQQTLPALSPRGLVNSEAAVDNFHATDAVRREGRSPFQYREYVIQPYLNAINAHYRQFVAQLQSGDRISSLFQDLVNLGFTGAAALVPLRSVDDLVTVGTIAAAAGNIVDRRLFFDRTVPALIAAMDAERAVIRSRIATNRRLPAERYTLAEAFDDLQALIDAGNIYSAATRVIRIAEADRVQQQTRLAAIPASCGDATDETAEIDTGFRILMIGAPVVGTEAVTQAQRAAIAAEELGLDAPSGTSPSWDTINGPYAARFCNDVDRRAFIERVRSRIDAVARGGAVNG